jgi:hypothetical protein
MCLMDLVELVGWNSLLFAAKWLFIGLIYFGLFIILIAVRRELSFRVESRQPVVVTSTGRLKVLDPGTDTHLRAGATIDCPLRLPWAPVRITISS